MDDRKITFQEIEDLSNRVGNYFRSKGYRKGDVIALLMETKCEYSSMWLGLSKIGVVTSLINFNLRQETLLHSLKVVESKAVIVGSELVESLREIESEDFIKNLEIYIYDDESKQISPLNAKTTNDFRSELQKTSKTAIETAGKIRPEDKLLFIYTSGTTGMPKAAVITNLRFQFMVYGIFEMTGLSSNDIVYNTLPLYHTAGGIIGVGGVLTFGFSMALRKKFSASNFWSDCIKYNCTVAQYIGEICRFLLLTPPRPEDTQHKIRYMFGNGLRPQIWTDFAERFNVSGLGEIYGATESNANLVNMDCRIGAVGFVPRIATFLYPVTLIRCDEVTGEVIRDENGRCTHCKPGEPGVFIGKINPKHAARSFAGYADKKASDKKILRNVFRDGDQYFDSSDVLVMDVYGYYYFMDRTGDTFRYRGENVSTTEVEGIIMKIAGLNDCVVYGVDIPNMDGKAGMAAIVDPNIEANLAKLSNGLKSKLPAYSRPVFIRQLESLPMTGTFKLKKRDLQLEGFDVDKIKDKIYLANKDGTYSLLTREKCEAIQSGKLQL